MIRSVFILVSVPFNGVIFEQLMPLEWPKISPALSTNNDAFDPCAAGSSPSIVFRYTINGILSGRISTNYANVLSRNDRKSKYTKNQVICHFPLFSISVFLVARCIMYFTPKQLRWGSIGVASTRCIMHPQTRRDAPSYIYINYVVLDRQPRHVACLPE